MTQAIKSDFKLFDILRFGRITEKTTQLLPENQACFVVSKDSTKPLIKAAVEMVFNVKVKAVNTLSVKGKKKIFKGRSGLRSDFKKAIVTLEPGYKIDMGSEI